MVQGYSPDLNWQLLAEGAVAINRGALWVATNLDPTVPVAARPAARQRLAGGGAALRHPASSRWSTGKPDPTMHRESVLRTGRRASDRGRRPAGHRHRGRERGGLPEPAGVLRRHHRAGSARRAAGAAPDLSGGDLSAILDAHPAPEDSGRAGRGAVAGRPARTATTLRLALDGDPRDGPARAGPAGRTPDGSRIDADGWTRCGRCARRAGRTGTTTAVGSGHGAVRGRRAGRGDARRLDTADD